MYANYVNILNLEAMNNFVGTLVITITAHHELNLVTESDLCITQVLYEKGNQACKLPIN